MREKDLPNGAQLDHSESIVEKRLRLRNEDAVRDVFKADLTKKLPPFQFAENPPIISVTLEPSGRYAVGCSIIMDGKKSIINVAVDLNQQIIWSSISQTYPSQP